MSDRLQHVDITEALASAGWLLDLAALDTDGRLMAVATKQVDGAEVRVEAKRCWTLEDAIELLARKCAAVDAGEPPQ